jgi:uncharacterized SAM-binding protein YcdF (DUF218 family)
MREFIKFLMGPFNWYLVIFMVVLLLMALRKDRNALRVFLFGMVVLLLSSTGFIPDRLVGSLERRHPLFNTATTAPGSVQQVIVLGGGFSDNMELPVTQRLPHNAMGRLLEGVRIHKQYPGSVLVVTGGKGRATVTQTSVMAEIARALGAGEVVELSENITNTRSEAVAFAGRFGTGAHPVVVTDAMHMPRAMIHFEGAELQPLAAPTNFYNKGGTVKYGWLWLPSIGNIDKLDSAIKEYIGLLIAWMQNR